MLFFLILSFWQETNFLSSSFWHGVPLNLNLFGRNGKTSMAERRDWSRDDSISFGSMASLMPSQKIAQKPNLLHIAPSERTLHTRADAQICKTDLRFIDFLFKSPLFDCWHFNVYFKPLILRLHVSYSLSLVFLQAHALSQLLQFALHVFGLFIQLHLLHTEFPEIPGGKCTNPN